MILAQKQCMILARNIARFLQAFLKDDTARNYCKIIICKGSLASFIMQEMSKKRAIKVPFHVHICKIYARSVQGFQYTLQVLQLNIVARFVHVSCKFLQDGSTWECRFLVELILDLLLGDLLMEL